jgi:hypothetical protein
MMMLRHLRAGEAGGGAISVPMSVAAIAMIIAVGLAVDGVRAAQGVASADAVAEEAARSAGQVVDVSRLAGGTAVISPDAAAVAARTYLQAAHAEGEVRISGPTTVQVEVTVRRPTVLLGLVGVAETVSHGSAEAQLVAVDPGGAR